MKPMHLILLMLMTSLQAMSQDGTLDQSYGTFGIHHFAEAQGSLSDHFIDAQGYLVARDLRRVYRYRPDYRSLDTTFGTQGVLLLAELFDTDHSVLVRHISAVPGGGILVLSWATNAEQHYLLRLTSQGEPDSSWVGNGILRLDHPIFANIEWPIARQLPDGRIQIAATHEVFSHAGKAIRLLADGSPDLSYGNQGEAYTPVVNSSSNIYPTFIAPTGATLFGQEFQERYMMLDPDGNSAFTANPDGRSDQLPLLADYPTSAIITSNGNILVAGTVWLGGAYVARYNADGSIDHSFGADGYYEWDNMETAYELLEQADGNILVWGKTVGEDVCLSRLQTNGSLDTGFGNQGLTQVGQTGWTFMEGILFTPSNQILGFAQNFSLGQDLGFLFHNSIGPPTAINGLPITPLQVYPNPTSNYIQFELEKAGSYRLFSAQGRLLNQGTLSSGGQMVDISAYPAGVYQLWIQTGDKYMVAKAIRR